MAGRNLPKICQARISVKAPHRPTHPPETLTTNGTLNNDHNDLQSNNKNSSNSNNSGSFNNDNNGNNVNNNNDINNDYNNILK